MLEKLSQEQSVLKRVVQLNLGSQLSISEANVTEDLFSYCFAGDFKFSIPFNQIKTTNQTKR